MIEDHSPTSDPLTVVVLAAGAGTRMRSSVPKVLHPLAGRTLLGHALHAVAPLAPQETVAVIGHGRDQVERFLTEQHPGVRIAIQDEQLGTGHAVECGLADAASSAGGTVLVTYGDVPLLRTDTLTALLATHRETEAAATVLTAEVADPTGYGRVVRDATGSVVGIVEHKDAVRDGDHSVLAITEINTGIYVFDLEALTAALPELSTRNAQNERYLTDVIGWAVGRALRVSTVAAEDPSETEGVNDRVQLAALSRQLNLRLVEQAQRAGVTVLDPATTWIHADVEIGQDTVLAPGTSLEAGTVVGSGCLIGPDTTLSACTVGDGASVVRSHCSSATIGPSATVGPFSYLRPGAELREGAKVGAYVEVKKSVVGAGSKVPHLSYIGDCEIGVGVNVGAGTITANYDGVNKAATVIGDHAFVGTNSTLIAPVEVGAGAFVAAGSTISKPVPPGDLGVARGQQRNVPGWTGRRRPGTAAEQAATSARSQ